MDAWDAAFTVIVTMECQPEEQGQLVDVAKRAEPIFARQPGFVSSALHRSHDGKSVLQYLQWTSRDASDACMASPDWQDGSADDFMAFIHDGKATMQPMSYDIVSNQKPA